MSRCLEKGPADKDKNERGFVYCLIKVGALRGVKIGKTADLGKRIQRQENGNGEIYKMVLSMEVECPLFHEHAVHKLLRDFRLPSRGNDGGNERFDVSAAEAEEACRFVKRYARRYF
jgi:hypothetical protein